MIIIRKNRGVKDRRLGDGQIANFFRDENAGQPFQIAVRETAFPNAVTWLQMSQDEAIALYTFLGKELSLIPGALAG